MRSYVSKEIVLRTVDQSEEKVKVIEYEMDRFLAGLASIPDGYKFREVIHSFNISNEGVLAQVWTPYTLYSNGKILHSGVNAFTLVKENDTWKIIHLIDTRYK